MEFKGWATTNGTLAGGFVESMSIHYSYEPVIDNSSEVLILGSLPGPESLQKGQYYANPHNQFWRIIFQVFEADCADLSYDEKVSFLIEHKVALWDVFYSADRTGALDADIRNELPNDIAGLLLDFPNINRILLNGKKAETSFRKSFPDICIDAVYVPSTSPAYAKMSLAGKTREWKAAILQPHANP